MSRSSFTLFYELRFLIYEMNLSFEETYIATRLVNRKSLNPKLPCDNALLIGQTSWTKTEEIVKFSRKEMTTPY